MKREEILNISCKALKGKWNKKRLKYLLEFIPQNHLDLIYEINIKEKGIIGIDIPYLAWTVHITHDKKLIELNPINLNLPIYRKNPIFTGYHVIPHEIGHTVFKHGYRYAALRNFDDYCSIVPMFDLYNDDEIEAECYAQYIHKLSNYKNWFNKFPYPIKEKVISLF